MFYDYFLLTFNLPFASSNPYSLSTSIRLLSLWWIFQCKCRDPRQEIIILELEAESSDAANKVWAKIQNKGLSYWSLDLQMQSIISRPKSKTRNYHFGGWIIWCNWQCQGKNPRQGIITVKVKFLDAIDKVKAKIQDKELSPWRLNILMQSTMTQMIDYHARGWIIRCNQQIQGQNPKRGIIM